MCAAKGFAAGLWYKRYSIGFVVADTWLDRGKLIISFRVAPLGKVWRDLYDNTILARSLRMQHVSAITLVLQPTRHRLPMNLKSDDLSGMLSIQLPNF